MKPEPSGTSSGNVLVVDDQPANLQVLSEMLRGHQFKVRPAISGALALQAARYAPPDLILLDINMPEMDGYEVCRQLKADPELRSIPVIFLSALGDSVDKVRGFRLGAADYVTKPFQFDELLARVRAHIELFRLRGALEASNARLEDTVARRTRELAAANARLAILDRAKGDFLNLISHELRTPLTGVFGVTDLLLESCTSNPDIAECRRMYEQSRRRLLLLIDDALLLTQIGTGVDGGGAQSCSLDELLATSWVESQQAAEEHKVRLPAVPTGLGTVRGTQVYLARAFRSLLETAIKFARAGTVLRVSGFPAAEGVRVLIETDGRGIPPETLPRFFELMATANPLVPGEDLGLALPVAERIVTLFGGSVSVENRSSPGIRLTVTLRLP